MTYTKSPLSFVYGGYKDEQGNPVKKTKREFPYSYDPYVFYKAHNMKTPTHSVYSDRMFQWDYEKYNNAAQKVFGNHRQDLSGSSGNQLQQLLREYYNDDTIILQQVIEYCNVSTGYPCWRLDYTNNINQ